MLFLQNIFAIARRWTLSHYPVTNSGKLRIPINICPRKRRNRLPRLCVQRAWLTGPHRVDTCTIFYWLYFMYKSDYFQGTVLWKRVQNSSGFKSVSGLFALIIIVKSSIPILVYIPRIIARRFCTFHRGSKSRFTIKCKSFAALGGKTLGPFEISFSFHALNPAVADFWHFSADGSPENSFF